MGEKVTFPELTPGESDLLEGFGQRLANLVGFEDFVRFDWKRDEQGVVTFLEANPLAGLSYYYSVLPKMAEQAGMTYVELLATLAHSALSKREDRRYWYGRTRLRP